MPLLFSFILLREQLHTGGWAITELRVDSAFLWRMDGWSSPQTTLTFSFIFSTMSLFISLNTIQLQGLIGTTNQLRWAEVDVFSPFLTVQILQFYATAIVLAIILASVKRYGFLLTKLRLYPYEMEPYSFSENLGEQTRMLVLKEVKRRNLKFNDNSSDDTEDDCMENMKRRFFRKQPRQAPPKSTMVIF
jgi:hypothetical protein